MAIAETLATFVADSSLDDVPSDVVYKAKDHFLDTIGVALASSSREFGHGIARASGRLGSLDALPRIRPASARERAIPTRFDRIYSAPGSGARRTAAPRPVGARRL